MAYDNVQDTLEKIERAAKRLQHNARECLVELQDNSYAHDVNNELLAGALGTIIADIELLESIEFDLKLHRNHFS